MVAPDPVELASAQATTTNEGAPGFDRAVAIADQAGHCAENQQAWHALTADLSEREASQLVTDAERLARHTGDARKPVATQNLIAVMVSRNADARHKRRRVAGKQGTRGRRSNHLLHPSTSRAPRGKPIENLGPISTAPHRPQGSQPLPPGAVVIN